jgi:hypothetical protein
MLRFITILLALAVGCGPPVKGPDTGPVGASDEVPPAVAAKLVIPPTAETSRALETLGRAAGCRAAWVKVRYLLDLFDAVRLLPRDTSIGEPGLALLWKGLDLPNEPARGRDATRRVIEGLRNQLALERLSICAKEHVKTAVALLQADEAPRGSTAEALRVAVAYKRIARSGSPLSPNAQLRLIDWCAKAFQLAAGGDPHKQHGRINQCLFPLYPADPTPYFQLDPAARPPDPPWPVLRSALERATRELQRGRLKELGTRMASHQARFFEAAAGLLPAPLDLSSFKLTRSTHGIAWDRTPVVVVSSRGYLVGGRAVLAEDAEGLVQAIAKRLHNDQRRQITLVAAPDCEAQRILDLGRAARKAGARLMTLGVTRKVAGPPPRGDVQFTIFGQRPVLRLEGIPIDLALLSTAAPRGYSRDLPRGVGYDPRTAKSELAAVIDRSGVRISSKDGRLAPVKLPGVQAQLKSLKGVYANDRSLVLAPGRGALLAELVAVAAAARKANGQPLFPGVALATPSRINAPAQDLRPTLRLFSMVRVKLEPILDQSWPGRVRTCYQETLRGYVEGTKPPPEGRVIVFIPGGKQRSYVRGLRQQRKLHKCLLQIFDTGAISQQKFFVRLSLDRG